VAGWLHIEINVQHRELNPNMIAHLSTNWARRRLTWYSTPGNMGHVTATAATDLSPSSSGRSVNKLKLAYCEQAVCRHALQSK